MQLGKSELVGIHETQGTSDARHVGRQAHLPDEVQRVERYGVALSSLGTLPL